MKEYDLVIRFSLKLTVLVVAVGVGWAGQVLGREGRSLSEDGIHDPDNPSLEYLQNPTDAFNRLPSDTAGNKVNWIKALRGGYIRPRSELETTTEVEILDTNILMGRNRTIPRVLFPHKAHTEWLDCGNCHEEMFVSETGANPVNMGQILEGEYCGTCHGAVAFPLMGESNAESLALRLLQTTHLYRCRCDVPNTS